MTITNDEIMEKFTYEFPQFKLAEFWVGRREETDYQIILHASKFKGDQKGAFCIYYDKSNGMVEFRIRPINRSIMVRKDDKRHGEGVIEDRQYLSFDSYTGCDLRSDTLKKYSSKNPEIVGFQILHCPICNSMVASKINSTNGDRKEDIQLDLATGDRGYLYESDCPIKLNCGHCHRVFIVEFNDESKKLRCVKILYDVV